MLFLAALVQLQPAAAQQSRFVPEGQCAVVVASRLSLAEARSFAERNFAEPDTATIYESDNGWFAISLGLLPREAQKTWLDQEKRAGRIPSDSFCALGARFIAMAPVRETVPTTADSAASSPPRRTSEAPAAGGGPVASAPAASRLSSRQWAEWIASDTPPWEGNRNNLEPKTRALTPQQWRAKLSHINVSEAPFCIGMPEPYTGFRDLDRLRRLAEMYDLHNKCLRNLNEREIGTLRETVAKLGGTLDNDGRLTIDVSDLCNKACHDAFIERMEGFDKRRERLRRHNEIFQRQMYEFHRALDRF